MKTFVFKGVLFIIFFIYPIIANAEYLYNEDHWNKHNLNYYVYYNTTSQMTYSQRQTAIGNAFATWSAATVFHFQEVYNASQADILLSWQTGNHGSCATFDGYVVESGVVAHTFFSNNRAYIHFDDDDTWTNDGTGADLESVALHEIGHALGLADVPGGVASVMVQGLVYGWTIRSLYPYDKLAIGNAYGYTFEITGPTVPAFETIYNVSNIFDGCSVSTWTFNGEGNPPMFQLNGWCMINNENKHYIKGTLSTSVYYNNEYVTTLTKTINTGANFTGTYSQEGGEVIGLVGGTTYYAPIPTTAFIDGANIDLHRQLTATITSPLFSNSTLTSKFGSFPSGWHQNGNTITYTPPRLGGAGVMVTGRSNTGYDVFKFNVTAMSDPVSSPSGMSLSASRGCLRLGLNNAAADAIEEPIYDTDALLWKVTVQNVQTGEVVFNGTATGLEPTIPTSGWNSGLYAIRATVENLILNSKIYISKQEL